ncbi:MAG: protein translocase subunit SecD [Armatimonadetes bacterium]|nr:protein translocase subunit SecD [Armatimonadota bacterium]
MQRRKSFYFLLIVLALAALALLGDFKLKTIFGLDITGGTRLTYRLEITKDLEGKVSMEEARGQIIKVLQRRAMGMGAAEPLVAAKGDDQVIVELPGETDIQKAREVMGTSARMEFYHARNVVSGQDQKRTYMPAASENPNDPLVHFVRVSDGKKVEPKSDEYKEMIQGWTLILAGTDVKDAKAEPKPGGDGYQPLMEFSVDGQRKMSAWSTRYFGKEEPLAVVLDGKVLSIANMKKDTRLEQNCVTEGNFTNQYVLALVDLINGGSLPANLHELGAYNVSATIGATAYNKILTAGIIAFSIISVYLIVYYAFAGFVAFLALLLYTGLTLAALKFINATFSLAAIAGFILSVGMAVDANILVFERFKEEMKNGRSLHAAIEIGFKRALPAIVDSNACTILTCLVLSNIGTGPVKGFATTLIIGVVISLFTAVTVTRSLLFFFVDSGIGDHEKWYAIDRDWFGAFLKKTDGVMPVLQKSKKWFLISAITVVFGMLFVPAGGFKLNVELQGGSEAQYSVGANVTEKMIGDSLDKAGYKGSTVKFGSETDKGRVAIISVPEEALKNVADKDRATTIATAAGIPDAHFEGIQTVGPTLQKEVQISAITGVAVSILLIIGYLAFRFGFSVGGFKGGLKFGLSAIGALFHDILVVIFMAAFFGFVFKWDISSLFLTAMLTIIGFSVHDTIVIFDRIRENLHHPEAGEDLEHLMNRSITQSFSRSLNTSGTVIVTLLILVLFGTPTPDLKFFVVTMLIGIVSGTYSSIYNASPILYLWDKATVKKQGEGAGLVGLAKAEIKRSASVRSSTHQTVPRTQANTSETGRSYGQVRRRAKDTVKDSWKEID